MTITRITLRSALIVLACTIGAAYAGSTKLQGNIVPPPVVFDGGVDLTPAGAPNGVNDTVAVPSSSGCPLPGVGACAADPNILCSMAPGSGSDTASGACPAFGGCGGCSLCVEILTGPDGVTAGDVPVNHIASAKGKVQLQVIKSGTAAAGLKVKIKCNAKDVLDGANAKVTTTAAGTCKGGPNNGSACSKVADCNDTGQKGYSCISGDEFNCTIQALARSNPDNLPPCAGACLSAILAGPAGTGCGSGGGGLCVVGTCAGGSVRDGQPCDITGATDCPNGFCDGVGLPVVMTGDEVGFLAPSFGGTAYLLCPFEVTLGFPFDVKNGSGSAQADIAQPPLSTCIPAGTDLSLIGANIHESSPDGTSDLVLIGLHSTAGSSSTNKVPCPDMSLPLPGSAVGLPSNVGIGPIVGTLGLEATP